MSLTSVVAPLEIGSGTLSDQAYRLEEAIAKAIADAGRKGEVIDFSVLPARAVEVDYEQGSYRSTSHVETGFLIVVKVRLE